MSKWAQWFDAIVESRESDPISDEEKENKIYVYTQSPDIPFQSLKDAENGYLYAIGLGDWGVVHNYSINFKNASGYELQVTISARTSSHANIKVNNEDPRILQRNREDFEMIASSIISKDSEINIVFSLLLPVATAGFEYKIDVDLVQQTTEEEETT